MNSELLSNFSSSLIGQVISGLANGVLILILTNLLSNEEYGTLFLAISIFMVFQTISKLGFAKSAARYINEYKERKPGQVYHVLRSALIYNSIAIIGAILLLTAVKTPIVKHLNQPELNVFLSVGTLYIVGVTYYTFVRFSLQGLEFIKFGSYLHAVNSLSRLLISVILVTVGFEAIGAFYGYITSYFVAGLIGAGYLYFKIKNHFTIDSYAESGLARQILEYNLPLTLTDTAHTLDKEIDTVLIGMFLTPVAVSYYVLSKQIERFLEIPANALGFSITPAYAAMKNADGPGNSASVYSDALANISLLYFAISIGVFIVSDSLISNIFGGQYVGAVPILKVFSLYLMVRAWVSVTDTGLDYIGRAKARSIVITISTILNIVLNILLIPRIGVVGAAYATLVAQTIYCSANLWIIINELNIDYLLVIRKVGKNLLPALCMGMIVQIVSQYVSGVFGLAVLIITGIVSWSGISLGLGVVDSVKVKNVFLT